MRKTGFACVGVALAASWQIAGCAREPITIPVAVSLGGSSSFPVSAGVPTTKSINVSNTNTSGISAGQGNLELDPDAISIVRGNGGGKIRVQAQTTQSCTDQAEGVVNTCLDEGLGADCEEEGRQFLANCLSGAGQIEATVWITSSEAAQAACASGSGVDTYGPYTIQLDENDDITSISGSPQSLTSTTIEWFNTVGLRICIEIVAGFDGEVVVDSLTFNVGL
jgi:hypothetical protein